MDTKDSAVAGAPAGLILRDDLFELRMRNRDMAPMPRHTPMPQKANMLKKKKGVAATVGAIANWAGCCCCCLSDIEYNRAVGA